MMFTVLPTQEARAIARRTQRTVSGLVDWAAEMGKSSITDQSIGARMRSVVQGATVKFLSMDGRHRGLVIGLCAAVIGALVAAVVVLFPDEEHRAPQTAVRPASESAPTNSLRYVALGSSYASGPGGTYTSDSNRCARSINNYPHQVAVSRSYRLVDVTCGGAVTRDLLLPSSHPAQIDAVSPDTSIVTITSGGNDINYIGRLYAMSCVHASPAQIKAVGGRGCPQNRFVSPEPTADQYARVTAELVAAVQAVRLRAPRAHILLVEYPPAINPAAAACPALPLDADQIAETGRIWSGLEQATQAAGQAAGVTVVAAPDAMEHTVCSPQPWINGYEPPAPFHPNVQGKRAMADMVLATLG